MEACARLGMTGLWVSGLLLQRHEFVTDLLWGNFLAAGDRRPMVRVIEALTRAYTKVNKRLAMIGNIAEVTLVGFAKKKHLNVMQICMGENKTQPKHISMKLKDVVRIATIQ